MANASLAFDIRQRVLRSATNLFTPDAKGIFAGSGFLWLSLATLRVLPALAIYLLPSRVNRYQHAAGSWALITGSSDGIGFALAEELSRRGFNVILHGRNPDKLAAVSSNLSAKFPNRNYKVLVADAAAFPRTAEAYEELLQPIKDLNITILVNNVGNVGAVTERPIKPLSEWPHDELDTLVNINLTFTLHITKAMLPILQRHQPSLIVNVGSVAAAGLPYLETYSGTKAFLKSWSRGLGIELNIGEKRDIEVLHVEVGEVSTPSNPMPGVAFKTDATTFSKALVDKMGWKLGSVTAWWGHLMFSRVLPAMPEWLFGKTMGPMMRGRSMRDLPRVDHFKWDRKKDM